MKHKRLHSDALVETLQVRAEELAHAQAHVLGVWQTAKRRWGKGATQAWCPDCCAVAIVLPWGGSKHASTKLQASMPAIVGDAVFEPCERE